MAQKQGDAIDMVQLEILNQRVHNLAAAPGTPQPGQIWYDTTAGAFMYRAASTNIDLRDRANHTGTQLANTISNLAATVKAYRLDEFAAPTAPVSLGTQKITNLANGAAASDAATKGQVDTVQASIPTYRLDQFAVPTSDLNLNSQKLTNVAAGSNPGDAVNYSQLQGVQAGLDWKDSVKAAASTNITLSGPQTVDGVAVTAGMRVLTMGQSAQSENRIWIAQAGAWTPAPDSVTGTLTPGAVVSVEEGTANGGKQFRLQTTGTITVGSTALGWTQFGASQVYTADGTTIQLSGNNFSAITAGNGSLTRKWSGNVGGSTSIAVVHNLNTEDVTWSVKEMSSKQAIGCGVTVTDANTITLTFAAAPAASSIRVVVHG